MNYNVEVIPHCKRKAKKLSKKYNSFKNEFIDLVISLETNPMQGIPIGSDCYKIKIAVKSKVKGKSSGIRALTHIIAIRKEVYLLTIWDKSERDNISNKELKELLKQIPE